LLARSRSDGGAQRQTPSVGRRYGTFQPEAGKHRGLIYVGGDLFSPALSGDVLGVGQLGAAGGFSKSEEIVGDHRHCASRALLPRRIGCRIDDHLADDPPTGVV
jgi:hypothetical protein